MSKYLAVVGPNVELTTGCIIGTMCELITEESLPPNTVIVGRDCHRRINAEKPAVNFLYFCSNFFNQFCFLSDANIATRVPSEGFTKLPLFGC